MERNTVEGYTIRIASEEESDSIITLLKEVAQWLQDKEVDQWQYLLGGEATAEILDGISKRYTYVVVKEDEIVGTVTVSPKQNEWDERIFGKEEVSNSLYIHRFAVKRKYKGNGIGEWILQWVEENVQSDKEYLKLDCVGHNRTLNDFYKRCGFEYIGSTDVLSKFQKKRRKRINPINVSLVEKLIQEQFPEWEHLEIKPVKFSGHDNRTFHLGKQMSVRLPSDAAYVPQVEKENKWLPILSKEITLPISSSIAKGNPSAEYPWSWSINKWIEGETVTKENVHNLNEFATDLGSFLVELQSIDTSNGPIAGAHNFYRGGLISVYDEEARVAIENNKDVFDETLLKHLWDLALRSRWDRKPVWVHGDVAPGNLLVKDGNLCAVIDFGILGVGDPACDAAMAWTFFDANSRNVFKEVLYMDEETWNRARGWALWKALITYDANRNSNEKVAEEAYRVMQVIVDDYKMR